ncbi:hypothetical protein ONZ45_g11561 [Pleurotus djamor]|nr:hypothetical protein ONZ45_g11561 [Pleurotus djamor]
MDSSFSLHCVLDDIYLCWSVVTSFAIYEYAAAYIPLSDLRHSNRPQSVARQLETTVVGILEELTVTLGIYKRPEILPAVPNNDDASIQPGVAAEEPLQEIPPILQQLASYKSGYFPQIPSTRAPGMSDEAQKLLSKLARDSTELNQDFRVDQCEAEIVTLETYLDNLAWFLPSQYIAQSWAFAALFCFGMPLSFPNEGWFLVPGTLIVSGTLILFLVHSDDNEHLVNFCNKPCGLASIDNAPATLPESRVLAALYHRPQVIDSFLRSWQSFRAMLPERKTKEAINETSKSTSV